MTKKRARRCGWGVRIIVSDAAVAEWRTLAGTVNRGEVTCYSPACGAAPGRLHGEACEEERTA